MRAYVRTIYAMRKLDQILFRLQLQYSQKKEEIIKNVHIKINSESPLIFIHNFSASPIEMK